MAGIWQAVNIILTAAPGIIVFWMYRKDGCGKACVLGIGFFVVGFYVDMLFAMIMQGFAGNDRHVLMQVLGMVSSKCVAFSVLAGMWVFSKERSERTEGNQTAGEKSGWDYHNFLTLAITIFFLLMGISVRWQNSVGTVGKRLALLLVLLGLLSTYYISLYLYLKKQNVKVSQAQENSVKHEAEVYLEQVENNYQRTRELWHDLKNHINLMHLLLQDGKYEELEDYLRIFNEDVDSLTLPAKSGNLIVDALLSDKVARAKREKIEVSLELCDLSGLKLQPDEICGLLGNLLDNAIEANRHLREDRRLEVICKESETCYYIRVRNPVSVAVKDSGHGVSVPSGAVGVLATSKTDQRNRVGHGLGLRSAERIVHGCGGEMVTDRSDKYFTVVVRLPG